MKRIHKNHLSNIPMEALPLIDLPTETVPSIDLPTKTVPLIDLPTETVPSIDLPTEKLPSTRAKNEANKKQKPVHMVRKGLCLAVFVIAAICGVLYAYSWSLSAGKAQSETFTELYFEDNTHLPSTVMPKHPYYFQFTLHNLEGKDMEYPYEVYIQVGQDKLVFDKGTIFVKEHDYKTMQERFAAAGVLPRSEIVVELANKKQQVDFWIEGAV